MNSPTSPSEDGATSAASTPSPGAADSETLDHVTKADGYEDDGDQWNVVDKDADSTDDAPEADTSGKPEMPSWFKVVMAVAALIAIVLGAWIGWAVGKPTPEELATPEPPVPEWPMTPPQTLDDWVSAGVKTQEPPEGTERTVISSEYSTGSQQIVLVVSRPETDMDQYFEDAGVTKDETVGNATCGAYTDSQTPVCVRIADETAILVAGLSGQPPAELSALVDDFYTTMAGPDASTAPAPSPSPTES